MKKIIVSLIILVVLAACNHNINEKPIVSTLNTNPELEFVTLALEKQTFALDTSSITGMITNNSEFDIFTNGAYNVEFFDGSSWREVPLKVDEVAFVDIAIPIGSNRKEGFHFDLELVSLFEPGLYRIRTHVYNETDFPLESEGTLNPDEFDQLMNELVHELVAEFYLK